VAIEVNNVTKFFKISKSKGISNLFHGMSFKKNEKIIALNSISFTVNKGEVLGIIGTNGSGKSTLLRIIAGIYKPDIGFVKVNGSLSPLMQIGTGFQTELKAKENILMNGMLLGMSKKDIAKKIDNIMNYAELEKFSDMKLKHYSSGMRARLAFAIAMQIDPEILLVDEILSVGDKNFREKSYRTFLEYKNKKKTILYATHNLEKLSELCNHVLLINEGQKVMIGKPDEVIKKYNELNSRRI
jgi:ABC-type polysaccharide/polyol phosphate transport system ATPase subunit